MPSFRPRHPAALHSEPVQTAPSLEGNIAPQIGVISPAEPRARPAKTSYPHQRWITLTLGAFAAALLLLLVGSQLRNLGVATRRPVVRLFWQQLFPRHSTTLLVAADSGLVLLHGITGENTSLGQYSAHDLQRTADSAVGMEPEAALSLANRRYTSFVDLELFNRLTHLPEALEGSYSIRYARDIRIDDLKNANVILSGSSDANPWIEVYERSMNFVLQDNLRANIRSFVDRNPRAGEQPVYVSGKAEYGVLAYLASPGGYGNALIIEGTSVAGTESASDFLLNSREFETFLQKLRSPDGSLPHFEILVSAESLGGSAAPSRMVAYRTYSK